jgi:hypothetical protein
MLLSGLESDLPIGDTSCTFENREVERREDLGYATCLKLCDGQIGWCPRPCAPSFAAIVTSFLSAFRGVADDREMILKSADRGIQRSRDGGRRSGLIRDGRIIRRFAGSIARIC